jgi:hypothetical protein
MMSEPRLKENFHLTEALLQQQFAPPKPSLPLTAWLDPERYADLGSIDLHEAYEFLPELYKPLVKSTSKDIDWRQIITQAVTYNETTDKNLERWLKLANLSTSMHKGAFYSIPFIPNVITTEKLGSPPQGTMWSFYILPLLLTKRHVEHIPIDNISRRELDYTELYSRKYEQMRPELSPPPAIIVNGNEFGNTDKKPFTLIEGAFRMVRAHEAGETSFPCKIISWQDIEPYINIQPIKGSYSYHLA